MPFDANRFDQAEFKPRTKRVPVPGLAAFFSGEDPAEWEVRGLNASELHRAAEAKQRQATLQTVVEALASSGEKAAELRKALGLDGNTTPGEIAKRQQMLTMGSVCPVIDEAAAVKLSEAFPIEFLQLTNEITELTGQGFDLVKPAAASQQTPASTTA